MPPASGSPTSGRAATAAARVTDVTRLRTLAGEIQCVQPLPSRSSRSVQQAWRENLNDVPPRLRAGTGFLGGWFPFLTQPPKKPDDR